MIEVSVPGSLAELWDRWAARPEAALYAGGTDLLVKLRAGRCRPSCLICLERIPELQGVEERDGTVRIGAATPHTRLVGDPRLRAGFPMLIQALLALGSPPIRNAATIGGNICTASPAGDTLPPLFALDAVLELESRDAARSVPIREFIMGPGRTALRPGELIRSIVVPRPAGIALQHFEKVGQRKAMAIAVASLAALLVLDAAGRVVRARLAWGSVGPGIVTCPDAEVALVGRRLDREAVGAAAAAARSAVSPIDDLRASAAYRRRVAANLVYRLTRASPST